MPDDLYVRLPQPADPTDGLEFDRDRGGPRPLGAVTATHTETIETTRQRPSRRLAGHPQPLTRPRSTLPSIGMMAIGVRGGPVAVGPTSAQRRP
jgi:hypothetical protein